jgi:putative membrane protein
MMPLAVAAVLATALVGTGAASAATGVSAASGVEVTNSETVQVYVDPDGKLGSQRIYEQLVLTGHGKADVVNPITTTGLRNLDGFSGIDVKDGKQIVDTTVDGEKAMRSVSDYHGKLPLKLAIAYKLDGKPVKAGDIVGKSGHLEVTYTVENVSGAPTELTFDDGKGGTVTKTVNVPIPMVASMSTDTPASFRNVSSKEASMGGDGHGGTMMQFTLTLLPPIGPAKASFGYSADITDGVIPRAEISALPVDPLSSPTFASAASSYKDGADTGVQLTGGALQMDAGLIKLRGGASDLVAGLIKLHDGAGQLSSGLNSTAVPGAKKLADGTSQLDAGGKQLKDGAGQLSDGLQQLKSKAPQLADGVSQLYAGQKQLAAGLTKLYEGVTDQGKQEQLEDLIGWVNTLHDDIGSTADATAAIDPKKASETDFTSLLGALAAIESHLENIAPSPDQEKALQIVRPWLDHHIDPQDPEHKRLVWTGRLTTDAVDALLASIGMATVKSSLAEIAAGLGTPSAGCPMNDPDAQTLRGCMGALVDGGKKLKDAVPQLRKGVNQLAAGSQQLATGADDLSDGLGQANDGAHQLADGLGDAADGAGQIDDGLGTASDGAPQLVDGAQQLSTEGSQKIAEAGQETAQSYGEMYAELVAGAKRANTESMAVGAPAGAASMTAYQFIVTGADGQGSRNTTRTMLAGGLLIVAAGGLLLRRRFQGGTTV